MTDTAVHVSARQILRVLETDALGAAAELETEAAGFEAKARALRADAARVRAARAAAFPVPLDVGDFEEETL